MWYVMSNEQAAYDLSEKLIRAINQWNTLAHHDLNVEDVLEEGADVNRLHGTLLPLHCACMVGDIDCVRILMERGALISMEDGYGRCAIHYAAEKDDICLEYLISKGADVDQSDANGDTALHWASYKDKPACVRVLLRNGADVNAQDHNGDSALSWAAQRGCLESMRILLEYNAEVTSRNLAGLSPIQRVARTIAMGLGSNIDELCLSLLLRASAGRDLLTSQGDTPSYLRDDNRLSEYLLPVCVNARSLQHICRVAVRRALGNRHLPQVAPQLPLPPRMQDYIILRA